MPEACLAGFSPGFSPGFSASAAGALLLLLLSSSALRVRDLVECTKAKTAVVKKITNGSEPDSRPARLDAWRHIAARNERGTRSRQGGTVAKARDELSRKENGMVVSALRQLILNGNSHPAAWIFCLFGVW
jgi:hypothetical protein